MKLIPRFLCSLPCASLLGSWAFWMTVWSVVVIIAVTIIALTYWDQLNGSEPLSATVRNLIVVVAGLIGLPLTLWRSSVAARQANTAQRSLLDQRYQKGAEMLGSADLWTRVGGVFALQSVAQDHPQEYHVQVMRLFCAFFREKTPSRESDTERDAELHDGQDKEPFGEPTFGILQGQVTDGLYVPAARKLSEDSQAVFDVFNARGRSQIEVEEAQSYYLNLTTLNLHKMDLRGANFENVDLSGTDLSKAILWQTHFRRTMLRDTILRAARLDAAVFDACDELTHSSPLQLNGANLFDANFDDANLFGAQLVDANLTCASLSNAHLAGANLAGAILTGAIVSGASFSEAVPSPRLRHPAVGLTQSQFDQTSRSPKKAPILEHVVDVDTDEPLVWRG